MAGILDSNSMSMAVAAAVGITGSMYVDAKYHLLQDVKALLNKRRTNAAFAQHLQDRAGQSVCLYSYLREANPTDQGFWFEGKGWTYTEIWDHVDRLSQFVHDQGIKQRDVVAVYMTNSPELYFAVYALSRLGVTCALINSSLTDDTLHHCITLARAHLVLTSPDLASNVHAISSQLDQCHTFAYTCGSFAGNTGLPDSVTLLQANDLPVPSSTFVKPIVNISDIGMLIYTSGTTGKPKACAIRYHFLNRLVAASRHSSDHPLRIYSSLPLFHGTCMFVGLVTTCATGGCFCLARKFSARRFWKDCHDSQADTILYVGELCRYLLATPPSPYDRDHNVQIATGNGMRGEVWDKFKERFGIPIVFEYYRATETVAGYDYRQFGFGVWGAGKVGHSGLLGRWMEDTTYIVRYDYETDAPWRHPKTGMCVRCKPGEVGEAVGRVMDVNTVTRYLHNDKATESKFIRDVFKKGDLFQRTGDLLVQDQDGFFTFVDRTGDTYRWKGENVSAGEVREYMCNLPGVVDVVVFGLGLKAFDGQAGCATIFLNPNTNIDTFMAGLYKALRSKGVPTYAAPRLIRVSKR